MYEKTNFLCLTMQRYDEKAIRENPFNESVSIFSKAYYLYFVSICQAHGRSSIARR